MGCSLPILVVLVGVLRMRQGSWLLPAAQWTPRTWVVVTMWMIVRMLLMAWISFVEVIMAVAIRSVLPFHILVYFSWSLDVTMWRPILQLNLYCSLHVSSSCLLSSAYLNPNPEPWAEAFVSVLLVRCMLGYACPYVHSLFTNHSLWYLMRIIFNCCKVVMRLCDLIGLGFLDGLRGDWFVFFLSIEHSLWRFREIMALGPPWLEMVMRIA